MPARHQFADEWLLRLVERLPDAPLPQIDAWRGEKREYLSQSLLDAGILTFPMLAALIRNAYHIDSVEVAAGSVDRALLSLVPESLQRKHRLVPVASDVRSISIAMVNPLDPFAADDVRAATGRTPVPLFCPPGQLKELLADQVNPETIVFDLVRAFGQRETIEVLERESEDAELEEANSIRPPVVQLVDAMITNAVQQRASDVHLEHEETSSIVRFRVDGLLKNVMILPRYVAAGPVVSRIKIMAGLDVASHFQPQDGRAKLRVGKDVVGLRVSTLPSRNGEKVVMRILNEAAVQVPLGDLGFHTDVLGRFREMLGREQGVVLVTGPTGSGKTTTLYAALNELRSEQTNVVTAEDPIEYRLDGITQVQVNEKQGLTFPAVLRSVLRQDPDVILVGEIRDRETAQVAMQAALTGHLVLSTLHTNDTVGAVERLADMGIERFKIASGIIGVTAQRLVRRLCRACSVESAEPLPPHVASALERLGLPVRSWKQVGCAECGYNGYRGRLPLIELLEITRAIRDGISAAATPSALYDTALRSGALHTLELDALWHLSRGDTTWAELAAYVDAEGLEHLLDARPSEGGTPATVAAAASALPAEAAVPAVAAAPTAPAPAPAPAPAAGAGKRVIVGVGDPIWQAVLPVAFGSASLDFELHTDGAALLGAIARGTPEGVVIGPGLATLTPPQVIEAIRKVLGLVDLPVLAIGSEAEAESLRASGATDVITPPVDPAALGARLLAAVQRRTMWSDTATVMRPPTPVREAERLEALRATALLDSDVPEERFDRITRAAMERLNVPMALVSLVDEHRQWFKSHQGLSAPETAREISFCGHGINYDGAFVVQDARLDPRFSENPLVEGDPHVRAYAGFPITSPDGHNIGMMCVMDRKPRAFTAEELRQLEELGREVEKELWPTG